MSEMEKFTPLAKKFTLPPALTGWTNSISAKDAWDNDFIFRIKGGCDFFKEHLHQKCPVYL